MNIKLRRIAVAVTLLALVGAILVPFRAESASAAPASSTTAVFRFYKVTDGSHFFTSNENEKNQVEAQRGVYKYEGIAFYSYPAQQDGTVPVHRFYNFKQGVHFYTSDQNEFQTVLSTASSTFRYEGIAYYANSGAGSNVTPVYRFYKFRQGVHFYTSNQAEASNLNNTASGTYRFEGASYYLPSILEFSGSGSSVTGSFILPSGLSVFRSSYTGSTSFIVNLLEANTGDYAGLIAAESGSDTSSVPLGVEENRYVLEVQSRGSWSITVEQPKSSAGYIADFNGSGSQATTLFSLEAGPKTFSYSYNGSGSFIVYLLDGEGNYVDLIAAEAGTSSGGSFTSTDRGNHILSVQSRGSWAISVR